MSKQLLLSVLATAVLLAAGGFSDPIPAPAAPPAAVPISSEVTEQLTCPQWLFDAWRSGRLQGSEGDIVMQVGDADIESKHPQKSWRERNVKLDLDWESWKRQFHKYYFTKHEEQIRRLLWEDNKALIDAHNRMYERGGVNYKMQLTQFSDLSEHEYRNMHGLAL